MSEKGKAPEPDMENTIRAEAPDMDAGRPGDVPAVTETMDVQMLASLLMDPGSALDIPKPYAREIYLFDTYVAGTRYAPDIEKLERELEEGETLFFVREPENPYDELAIRIQTKDGAKVGYVPRADNVVFSRLMDAGKKLFARITKKEGRNEWLWLGIRIFLNE